jgi:hypothetical protein
MRGVRRRLLLGVETRIRGAFKVSSRGKLGLRVRSTTNARWPHTATAGGRVRQFLQ